MLKGARNVSLTRPHKESKGLVAAVHLCAQRAAVVI